ncbi:hypothetical protein H8356DRAFT_1415724 [Neocallimastix lanati (nom. inval.)]|nr:hypothetical protein H8356DRAFT_1415724 [Neocallimastix sp. JGI-2020a]
MTKSENSTTTGSSSKTSIKTLKNNKYINFKFINENFNKWYSDSKLSLDSEELERDYIPKWTIPLNFTKESIKKVNNNFFYWRSVLCSKQSKKILISTYYLYIDYNINIIDLKLWYARLDHLSLYHQFIYLLKHKSKAKIWSSLLLQDTLKLRALGKFPFPEKFLKIFRERKKERKKDDDLKEFPTLGIYQ